MMDVKEKVIECCQNVVNKQNAGITVDVTSEISRDSGIDSLGIVSLIFEIEDALNIELDEHLGKVRNCKNVGELIALINEIVNG